LACNVPSGWLAKSFGRPAQHGRVHERVCTSPVIHFITFHWLIGLNLVRKLFIIITMGPTNKAHMMHVVLTDKRPQEPQRTSSRPMSHARNLLVRKVPHRNPVREPRPSRPSHYTRLIALSSVPLSLLSAYPSLNDWTDFKRKQCSKQYRPTSSSHTL
jgi:hypothetical protein